MKAMGRLNRCANNAHEIYNTFKNILTFIETGNTTEARDQLEFILEYGVLNPEERIAADELLKEVSSEVRAA